MFNHFKNITRVFNYFKNMTIFNRIRFVVCFILIIAGIVIMIVTGMQASDSQEVYIENQATIEDLNHQLDELTKSSDATPDTIEIKKSLLSCKDIGNSVATYQNDYQNYRDADDEDKRMAITMKLSDCFEESDTNARVEWYNIGDSSKKWTWTFETNYSFSATSVPVLWTCRMNDTDELLAYTTGTYDTTSGLFKNVKWYNTLVGSSYINGTYEKGSD